jgi:hypothetical protein
VALRSDPLKIGTPVARLALNPFPGTQFAARERLRDGETEVEWNSKQTDPIIDLISGDDRSFRLRMERSGVVWMRRVCWTDSKKGFSLCK